MRPSFHTCASQPTLTALLALVVLCPGPGVSRPARLPPGLLPRLDGPAWERALLQLQAVLDVPQGRGWGRAEQPGEPQPRQPYLGLVPGQEEAMPRAQWVDPLSRPPLSPFPGAGRHHASDGLHYPEGGEDLEDGKRNEALTSIAGGLQAFSREKGGFGFRFGRKRHTAGGARSSAEEEMGEEEWN